MRFFVLVSVLFSMGFAYADATENEGLAIQNVELRSVPNTPKPPVWPETKCSLSPHFVLRDKSGIPWGDIVAIGKQIWEVVADNKPVISVEAPVVHALPRDFGCWLDMENWEAPKLQTFEVVYKNGFGWEVVKFRFRLQYTYGGSKNGHGRYLANVSVQPEQLDVMWAYTFNAQVKVGQTVNLGSAQDPVAGMELQLDWQVETVLKKTENSVHFFVQGDGGLQSSI